MKNYTLIIKDKDNIYKEPTDIYHIHEEIALGYFENIFGKEEIKDLPTIELAMKGYITVKSSTNFIVIALPSELNEDQKDYINNIRDFLKENVSKLYINDIRFDGVNYCVDEYMIDDLKVCLDELLDSKLNNQKKLKK